MICDWQSKRERRAFLALADGSVFRGNAFGLRTDTVGEVVFNTGMSGYQEITTDPSYAGQFVLMTSPEIGNYGCNDEDAESRDVFLSGMIVRELNAPSNWRSEASLDKYLAKHGKGGIEIDDTRRLTLIIRSRGSQKAWLHIDGTDLGEAEAVKRAKDWEGLDGKDYASKVTTDKIYSWNDKGDFKVAVLDFGVKYNILRKLAASGMKVTVCPAHTSAETLLAAKPDGIFLSNGPADPAAVGYAVETIRSLVGKVPLMGICLGHQLLSLACGAKTGRLKFGHHGCNHPVRDLATGKVEITSQNHNYALLKESVPSCLEVTHINLNDGTIEGIRHRTEPAFAVQYHPEAAPGPHDSAYLFEQFKKLMKR